MARKTVRSAKSPSTTAPADGGEKVEKAGTEAKGKRIKGPRLAKKAGRPKRESWQTTNEEEVERRRERARAEGLQAQCVDRAGAGFGVWEVWRSDAEPAKRYQVEIRSRSEQLNYCDCPDFLKNRLGICKHIVFALTRGGSRKTGASGRAELFVRVGATGEFEPALHVPEWKRGDLAERLGRFVDAAWELRTPTVEVAAVLLRHLDATGAENAGVWVSPALRAFLAEQNRWRHLRELKASTAESLRAAAGQASFLKHALYDYQIDGMLHLAFTGRALLADEMGLGKTVQAIAAARVLHELRGIRRTLVVTPASLKAEWEEQIGKFTDLSTQIVYGGRRERLQVYQSPTAFFILMNYEQVMRDWQEINELLQPDLVILDEAQRIKNWKAKTSRNIKSLNSPYAFVLTGTPLENRIDELYSLVEFVNPTLLGSLFHFNRRYYAFDTDGRPAGVQNLGELHRIVKQVMLRRRKDEIAEQLPERVDNNYFVTLTSEQRLRYDEHEAGVARIMAMAARRALRPEEFERLQLLLSCMRMLCDSVYILDSKISDSPKVDELLRILTDIWEDAPERKIIIFSEWVKMLELVQLQLDANGIGYALHTGSVPQKKRRDEIKRFKEDAKCLVFLSTDSGGVGLNLQAASVVVNLDLPWNPAKLEQRIARAWRKHQKNSVQVINLVAENTIEHRMLGTLALKQGLADAVLDARGDVAEIEGVKSRSQFLERLSQIMNKAFAESANRTVDEAESAIDPESLLRDELAVTGPDDLQYCGIVGDGKTVFAVAGDADEAMAMLLDASARAYGQQSGVPAALVITPEQHALLQQLAAAGVISFNEDLLRPLFERPAVSDDAAARRAAVARQKAMAAPVRAEAARQLKMAGLLLDNGFEVECRPALEHAASLCGHALLVERGLAAPEAAPSGEAIGELLTEVMRSVGGASLRAVEQWLAGAAYSPAELRAVIQDLL